MTNEQKIEELQKRIVTLSYSDTLPEHTQTITPPDLAKLKKLAKQIRKTVEDYPVEATSHSYSSN